MANQLLLGRALDQNGYIAPGALATIYADGTATLITVYSDVDGTTPAANPITADGDGFWPQRYVTEDAKAVVTTSALVALYTLDPAPTAQGTGAAASAISFTPTIQLPFTNAEDAINGAADLAVSGFAAFGLGITGNATLLAALDATGTGAGVYRFDGTTTGTYPTGVAAADTGMVEIWRQAGATAMMELHHATSNRVFRRRMTASVWGAWREVVNVNQATAEGDLVYRGASDFARLPKGTAGQFLAMNTGATAPVWRASPIATTANFNGFAVAGTYTRSGTTVTVTLTAHGMTTGQYVELDFTTGTATDGYYQVTVSDANTFTVTDTVSGATSGNVNRNIWVRKSSNVASISRTSAGVYGITFTNAAPDALYVVSIATDGGTIFLSYNTLTTTAAIVTTRNFSGTLTDVNSLHFVAFW